MASEFELRDDKMAIGDLFLEMGRAELAVTTFSQLIRLFPNSAAHHFKKALGYFRLQRVEDSKKFLDLALNLDPAHIESMILKADVMTELGEPEESESLHRKVIEINPEEPRSLAYLGTYPSAIILRLTSLLPSKPSSSSSSSSSSN